VVCGVVHGLDHVESERGVAAVEAAVGRAVGSALASGAAASGALLDGAWAVFDGDDAPIEAALALAATPAAVGLARGGVGWVEGVPQGFAARMARNLATAVRSREVALRTASLRGRPPPLGVGAFDAPEPLCPPGVAITLLRDYR
jgi:hypothetical protein